MIGTLLQHSLSEPWLTETVRPRGLGSSLHEQRVATIALRLFDLLSPVHGLGKRYREVLRKAALFHDCGRRFGAEDHHITGARLVTKDPSLARSAWERRCIAYLVRYHCGKVPALSRSEYLRRDDRRRKVKLLLGFLRAADGLDSRRVRATAIVAKKKDLRLAIQCWIEASQMNDARKAFLRRKKFKLLGRLLDLKISVHLAPTFSTEI
jgi:exopolyphosphatase/guanosine-5'-triphosphate,3'-diphosphate pyrophosphatase